MSKKIKLVLLDDNIDLCDAISRYVKDNYSEIIDVSGVAYNGMDGISLIRSERPDIALIDVIMPQKDGAEVLEMVKSFDETKDTTCIMTSAGASEFTSSRLQKAGADYFCMKPFEMKSLVNCIISAYNYSKTHKTTVSKSKAAAFHACPHTAHPSSPGEFAAEMLAGIGASQRLSGYHYLKSSIVKCIQSPVYLDMLTKSLYPTIGKDFGTNGQRVERSMRHLLTVVWSTGHPEKYYELTGETYLLPLPKPSIGAFLRSAVSAYANRD